MGGDLDTCLYFFLSGLKEVWMRRERLLQTAVQQGGFDDFTSPCLSLFIRQMGRVTIPATQGYGKIRASVYNA